MIITHILGYLKLGDLKNASTVCKSWHYASTDPQIVKTLILEPKRENFQEICKSNRKYGVLKLTDLKFDKDDSYYFEFFENFGPFLNELHICTSDLKIHHLLKLLKHTTCLTVISFFSCNQLEQTPSLFPLDYDCKAKNRIVKNLSSIKNVVIEQLINYPLIVDIVRCANYLDTLRISNKFGADPYEDFFTIFDNYNASNLTHLNLHLNCSVNANNFISNFLKIKNLNLRTFEIDIYWNWDGGIYNSSLFRQFILKLPSLMAFRIYGLNQEQLSLICQHLPNLKSLDCLLHNVQPISELENLKQLEKLRCSFSQDYMRRVNLVEIEKFIKCKFQYLRAFNFGGFITERSLVQLCENHPNLIELKLTDLLTRNLQIIFKYLTKLRVITINFGFVRLRQRPEIRDYVDENTSLFHSDGEYDYKITRLRDLEEFYLSELVVGISELDVRQLKKLHSTNLPELFRNK